MTIPAVHSFSPSAGRAVDQRQQRQASALPLVVGAHDDRDIFERHDDHHRPEDQAQHAVDVQRIGVERVVAGEGFAKRVDRRGADVAEHDADRADRQLGQRALGVAWPWMLFGSDLGGSRGGNAHSLLKRPARRA